MSKDPGCRRRARAETHIADSGVAWKALRHAEFTCCLFARKGASMYTSVCAPLRAPRIPAHPCPGHPPQHGEAGKGVDERTGG